MDSALKAIVRLKAGKTEPNVHLSGHSSWKIGGPADLLVQPESIEQVQILRKKLTEYNLPHIFIGDGSNLLFDDRGVRGVVIKIGRYLSRFSIQDNCIDAEAGVFVPKLVRNAGKKGLTGLEHAIGIPGTLGGLVAMNGGSMQQSISNNIEHVITVDKEGNLKTRKKDTCQFGYRKSAFQKLDSVIVKIRLVCRHKEPCVIRRDMLKILKSRREKFPFGQPNCGSVFVSNPEMYTTIGPPGAVIEKCGLKGFCIGGAQIPLIHANFIVNNGSAKSKDVMDVIRHTRSTVYDRTGHWLNCEVRYVTPTCQVCPIHDILSE
nr:UDP-N-acetylmuramate dehydrogenase [uncultured Desulfobacter sp.]